MSNLDLATLGVLLVYIAAIVTLIWRKKLTVECHGANKPDDVAESPLRVITRAPYDWCIFDGPMLHTDEDLTPVWWAEFECYRCKTNWRDYYTKGIRLNKIHWTDGTYGRWEVAKPTGETGKEKRVICLHCEANWLELLGTGRHDEPA